ncbi:35776_t:CDS:10, partial [Racocetra persica]
DDTDLNTLNIKEGTTIMMMGTPGELPKEPVEKTRFVEDMTDRQLAETPVNPNFKFSFLPESTPEALCETTRNTSNRAFPWCHPNAVELSQTASLRDLYKQLNQTTESCVPFAFVQALRSAFPQFDQRNVNGYLQQDAEECWTQIVTSLNNANIPVSGLQDSSAASEESSLDGSFVKQYMTGKFTEILKCVDAPDEPTTTNNSTFTKLSCITSEKDISYMQNGILMALDEKIEKDSPSLGHIANYTRTSRISRLPSYLTVGFVRFFWKNNRQIKTKITRRVQFPFDYDAYELCTDELKQKIGPLRSYILEHEKEKDVAKRKAKLSKNSGEKETAESKNDSKTNEINDEINKLTDPELAKDIGANTSGLYELCAVLTHIGRSADSGHYIGWARKHDSAEDWVKYDDDKVSIVPQTEIQKLDGSGGSAY